MQTIDVFFKINERMQAELVHLLENPNVFTIAQVLIDELMGQLNYLSNFKSAINKNGDIVDIHEVITKFEDDMCKKFKELTGKEYKPPIVRQMEFNRNENRIH